MKARLRYEIATASSEPEVRRLLRENPVSGNIEVSLEREPNAFHAAAVTGDEYQLVLAYVNDEVEPIGLGARFELDAFINGKVQRIGYLSELRATGGFKFRRSLLLQAYRAMRQYHEAGNAAFYLTTIIADNTAARRLLEAGLSDMPTYSPIEMMATIIIPVRSGARVRGLNRRVTTATAKDLPAIAGKLNHSGQSYQFHPFWSENTLRSPDRCRGLNAGDFLVCHDEGRFRGCLALWDQRSFKQTVIRGYASRLAYLRPAYNLVAPLFRRPRLPAPGASLESGFLSHLAVEAEDEATAVSLIRQACRHGSQRGLEYVMIGVAERNPICAAIRRHFPCHSYLSMLYGVYWEDGKNEFETLDNRIPHAELAIL